MDALKLAYASAANVAKMADPDCDWLNWPLAGLARPEDYSEASVQVFMDTLGGFCRANPTAPAEALFRFAAGRGLHDLNPDDFLTMPAWVRHAYTTFAACVPLHDRLHAEDLALTAQMAQASAPVAPRFVDMADTILGETTGIGDRFDDAPKLVNLGGPVPASAPAPDPASAPAKSRKA